MTQSTVSFCLAVEKAAPNHTVSSFFQEPKNISIGPLYLLTIYLDNLRPADRDGNPDRVTVVVAAYGQSTTGGQVQKANWWMQRAIDLPPMTNNVRYREQLTLRLASRGQLTGRTLTDGGMVDQDQLQDGALPLERYQEFARHRHRLHSRCCDTKSSREMARFAGFVFVPCTSAAAFNTRIIILYRP